MKDKEIKLFHYKGYLCAIRENGTGYLCGYVFLPENHKYRHEDHESKWSVHGEITFVDETLDEKIKQSEEGLWIGFDCAHNEDKQSPEYLKSHPGSYIYNMDSTYKNETYVRTEIKQLVKQLGMKPGRLVKVPRDFLLDLPL
jgi:hypothetical protein